MSHHPYVRFAAMILLSFAAMYTLMYAMIHTLADFFPNLNQFYMAGLMTMPMIILELVLMWPMYPKKWLNWLLIGIAVLLLGFFWCGIRLQIGVSDGEFVRSMVPHHSGAILMCEEAALTRPDLIELCDTIVRGQRDEIEAMKKILEQL